MRRILLAWLLAAALPALAAPPGLVIRTVEDDFEEVASFVAEAIRAKGLVVESVSRVGAMLNRTAADVGARRKVYRNANVYLFCSATYSRATMEADPRNVAFCPYRIFVYELADRPGVIHVGYMRLAPLAPPGSERALAAVDELTASIIEEALSVY